MAEWFVWYEDDYYEMGGVGLETFDTQQAALDFIESRIQAKGSKANLADYTLVEGKMLSLVPVQQVKKITVKEA